MARARHASRLLQSAAFAIGFAGQMPSGVAQEPPNAEPSASASTDAPAVPEVSEAERKESARARFNRGRELFANQAWAAALAEFLEARKIYPTWSATAWSAQCLKNLARFDEAFDMYASLLNDYGDKLPAEAKKQALAEVESMRRLVGNIEIEGGMPGAAIFVDRQARGEYPLLKPLRVSAGNHLIKVFIEGYEPFETQIDVAGATTARVVAKLRKLDSTGILRVIDQQDRALDVVVDGIVVGKTPLTLRIAPGDHIVFLRGQENLGTLPARVTVRGDNDPPLRLQAEPLEAELQVNLQPFDALIAVDAMTLGKGSWSGRVKPGQHTIEVASEGFLAEKRTVEIARNGKQNLTVVLQRDPKSPFWRKPEPPPHWLAEVGLSIPLATTIGGDIAGACTSACIELPGLGLNPMVRAGYELGSGWSFGGSAGFINFLQTLDERTSAVQVVGLATPNVGTVDDELKFRGGMLSAWIGYSFGEKLLVRLRFGAGAMFGLFTDVRTGSFQSSGGTPYGVGPLVQHKDAVFIHATPEIRIGYQPFPRFEILVGAELPLVFPVSIPEWNPAQAFTAGNDGYGYFNRESLLGSAFVLILPSLAARYNFR
jgi:hypothetical protein